MKLSVGQYKITKCYCKNFHDTTMTNTGKAKIKTLHIGYRGLHKMHYVDVILKVICLSQSDGQP